MKFPPFSILLDFVLIDVTSTGSKLQRKKMILRKYFNTRDQRCDNCKQYSQSMMNIFKWMEDNANRIIHCFQSIFDE